jgi:hypothetical protein
VSTLRVRDAQTEPGWCCRSADGGWQAARTDGGCDGEPEEVLQKRGRRVAGGAPVGVHGVDGVKISLQPLDFQTRRISRSCAHDSALPGSGCQSSVAETLVAGPPPPGSTASCLLALLATSVAALRSPSAVPLIRRAPSPANDGGSATPRQPREEWRWWLDTRAKGGRWWPRLVDNSGCQPAAVGGRPQP